MCLPPVRFRPSARALELARSQARALAAPAIGTEHLLLGLALEQEETGGRLLEGIDPDRLRALLPCGRPASAPAAVALTPRAGAAVGAADRAAARRGAAPVEVADLLVAVLDDPGCAAVAALERLGVDVGDLWCRAVAAVDRGPGPPVRLRRRGRVCLRGVGVSGSW
jgi:ATP-dependent Clp protease ATP-binding subunit ClpC